VLQRVQLAPKAEDNSGFGYASVLWIRRKTSGRCRWS